MPLIHTAHILVQALKPTAYIVLSNFAIEKLLQEEDDFLDRFLFSDESAFHLTGKVAFFEWGERKKCK